MSDGHRADERQAMTGSETDFREFVDARYADLLRLAYALTGSAHEAEDLVQGALVKVMRRWRRVDDPMAYLCRIMINQRTSWWRRYASRELLTAAPPERVYGDVADEVTDRQMVLAAMRTLAPRMRAVVALRYVADLPEAEVAAALDCSVGTVKSQASKGLTRLREALGSATAARRTTTATPTTATPATATTRRQR